MESFGVFTCLVLKSLIMAKKAQNMLRRHNTTSWVVATSVYINGFNIMTRARISKNSRNMHALIPKKIPKYDLTISIAKNIITSMSFIKDFTKTIIL
jgi:hypothetical protein